MFSQFNEVKLLKSCIKLLKFYRIEPWTHFILWTFRSTVKLGYNEHNFNEILKFKAKQQPGYNEPKL